MPESNVASIFFQAAWTSSERYEILSVIRKSRSFLQLVELVNPQEIEVES